MKTLLTPEATEWVGRSVQYRPYAVTDVDIVKYCHVLGITDQRSLEREAAVAAGHPEIVAPRGYHMVIRHTMPNILPLEELSEDGGSPDLTPPSSATRRMAGATRIRFHADIHAGDVVTLTKTVESLEEKVGRSGPLALVTYALDYRNQHGATAVEESYVRILR